MPQRLHRLYLDLQIAQSPVFMERGSIRYALEHARALINRPGLVEGVGFHPLAPLPRDLHPDLKGFPGLGWASARHFRGADAQGPLAYYIMSPFAPSRAEYVLPPYAVRPDVPMVVTLVDLTPLTSDDPFFKEGEVARRYRARLQMVEQAELVLTISGNTRSEAIELLQVDPHRVVNIGTGVPSHFKPAGPDERPMDQVRAALPELDRPFIMSVTGTWEWKNTHTLIEAYARLPGALRARRRLVVVCRLTEDYRAKWTALARTVGLSSDELVLTDLVSNETLLALYRSAELFVFPSLYEGFGLPAAEAAACGCPTITSNTSSMPEILDFPPALFSPHDAGDMAARIERALTDAGFREELLAAAAGAADRNRWPRVAASTEEALSLLPDPGGRRAGSTWSRWPPRIALVDSFTPGAQALDPVDLAVELNGLCDLDVIVADPVVPKRIRDVNGMRTFALPTLGAQLNPAAYDAIVYGFGADLESSGISDKAMRYPGILWPRALDRQACHPTFGHRSSALRRLLQIAPGVLVASPEQAQWLMLDQGPGASVPPCAALHGSWHPRQAALELVKFVQEL